MLDWPTLAKCHAIVPVYYWPVLWLYLARLEATAKLCRAEGRRGFAWHLERNGTIWISHMDASNAERRARGAMPADFDRTPWTRHAPRGFGPLGTRLAPFTQNDLSEDLCATGHPAARPAGCMPSGPLPAGQLRPP